MDVAVAVAAGERDQLFAAEMNVVRESLTAAEPDQKQLILRLGVFGEDSVTGSAGRDALPLERGQRAAELRDRRRGKPRARQPGIGELGAFGRERRSVEPS